MAEILAEVGLTIVITFMLAFIMKRLKQPPLVAYLLSGMLLGPFFFNILTYRTHYELLAHIGISTLLFIVGLQLNLRFIKNIGKVAFVTGCGQIIFTAGIGFFLIQFLGYSVIASIVIAIALTFSSTIIIVKLLMEKKALDTLHGRISLGFLLVQDVVAVVILLFMSSYFNATTNFMVSIMTVVGIAIIAFWIAQTYISKLFKYLESEMQILLALSWCLGLAGLMQFLGFSIEIGSLLAGVTLASSGQTVKISQKLEPFRDFFLVIFFVFLGAEMFPAADADATFSERMDHLLSSITSLSSTVVILGLFVLIGNPIIVFFILTAMRYSSKTAFLSGLAVSQISEFSIIITLLARDSNMITQETVSLITFIAVFTIVGSTYLFHNGKALYDRMGFLKVFESETPLDQPRGIAGKYHRYVLFGYGDLGFHIIGKVNRKRDNYILFDSDFHLVERLRKEGYNAETGDATDPTFLEELNFSKPVYLISSISDIDINITLLDAVKRHKRARMIAFAETKEDAEYLLERGAYEVIVADHLIKLQVEKTLKL